MWNRGATVKKLRWKIPKSRQPFDRASRLSESLRSLGAKRGGVHGETRLYFPSGVAELSDGTASWAIDANGATLTSTDITGTHTVPVMQFGSEIAIDYTGAYGGTELIFVFAKA